MADSNKSGFSERAPQPPLYAQVRNTLVRRLVEGVWAEGEMLPSEFELAADMGVSQGTVRKALDSLAADNLVVRRQGRGTFVAEHDEARILFQFFKLVGDSGEASFPESRVVSARSCTATAEDVKAMSLPQGTEVFRIHRVRSIGGRPVIAERIVIPAALFPGFADTEAPNNLYGLYARRYGVTVARAHERLKAVALPEGEALLLEAKVGTPALLVDRIAYGLDGSVIEWRVSHCLTDDLHYSSDLK
ncbi:GntR family transcriptional regulator [Alsobacter metallidurans]|uniref:GntR family transcriptional regulator n=1 Tax=Alsobacter metallidurans TaxID=340221 RepID=A0A917MIY6_9HYPH|nr:GntR family transcriptional regulator [Alsobacter metallidurans]GGH14077.1 GntR family transcriptional regulator [Alsobacter metallidurans]